MSKEIQSWYDRADMKKLALVVTSSDRRIVEPPDLLCPEMSVSGQNSIVADMWSLVEITTQALDSAMVPGVLEFQLDT